MPQRTGADPVLLFAVLACSLSAIGVQSQQNPRGTGARQNQTNIESDQQAANAQDENLRKPEQDKTNTPGAGVHVAPTAITFQDTTVGNTSAAKAVTLRIDGAALTMGAVVINNGEFSMSNSICTGTVTANSNCAIEINLSRRRSECRRRC